MTDQPELVRRGMVIYSQDRAAYDRYVVTLGVRPDTETCRHGLTYEDLPDPGRHVEIVLLRGWTLGRSAHAVNQIIVAAAARGLSWRIDGPPVTAPADYEPKTEIQP